MKTPTTPLLSTAESLPCTIASYSLAIASALEHKGISSRQVFAAAGMPIPTNTDPLQRVPSTCFARLYQACREVVDDPYFGLEISRFIVPSNLHALGYALWSSNTLMEFFQRLKRYSRVLTSQSAIQLEESSGELRLIHVRSPLAQAIHESEDVWLSFLIRAARSLYGENLKPLRVEMTHPMPHEGDAPYTRLFDAPVAFNCAHPMLVFDRSDMDVRLSGACPELALVNDNIATNYLAKLARADIVASTRAKIVELLASGRCTLPTVANALNLAPTTLKHKLAILGTSFQTLLDETRLELGTNYLRQPSLPITEITFLLGFVDASNFNRAFKRLTGMSPTAYRRTLGMPA